MIVVEPFGAESLARHRLSIATWRIMAVLASTHGQRRMP
jgi:hypothetical protein